MTTYTSKEIMMPLLLTVGILGNLAALIKLARRSRKGNFILLLRCVMSNNTIALIGVAIMYTLQLNLAESLIEANAHRFCAFFVVFRFFGACSGCIAVFMSIERYIVVSHVYFYQVHWTPNINKIAITGLTFLCAVMTFLPFFGFGIYIDEKSKKCLRYREVQSSSDRAYAYLFVSFGTLICVLIVTFNALVVKALIHNRRQMENVRIISSLNHLDTSPTLSAVEVKCSELMVVLDLSFIICWMPQMVATICTLWNLLQDDHWFYKLAEVLMIAHFTLDPYIYVLGRRNLQECWNIIQCRTSRRLMSPQLIGNTNPTDGNITARSY